MTKIIKTLIFLISGSKTNKSFIKSVLKNNKKLTYNNSNLSILNNELEETILDLYKIIDNQEQQIKNLSSQLQDRREK